MSDLSQCLMWAERCANYQMRRRHSLPQAATLTKAGNQDFGIEIHILFAYMSILLWLISCESDADVLLPEVQMLYPSF